MKSSLSWRGVGCLLGACLVAGCAGRRAPTDGGQAGLAAEDGSAEPAFDQRVEAYAEYMLGVRADLGGEPEAALKHYLGAAWAQPTQKALVVEVVGRLLQTGQPAEAVRLLERATSMPLADAELFAWLGFAYTAQGNIDLATRANRKAIERNPRLIQGYRNLALLYSENRQAEAALSVLHEAALLPEPDAGFLVALAELYAGHARLHPNHAEACRSGVLACLDRAVALDPEDPFLRQRIADGYRLSGRTEQAEAMLLELLEEHPGLPMVRETLAELYLLGGRKEDAARQLEIITRERPTNDRAAYFLGSIAYEQGRYADAELMFRRALLVRGDFEPAYCDLAAAILAQDRAEEALKVIEDARATFPKSFQLVFLQGVACARLERFAEAVRHFAAAELLAGEDASERLNTGFHFQYAAAAERLGDYAMAEARLRKSLELKPDFSEALNYLGYMWADRGENLEEARSLIERAVELEPENAAYLDSLAWVLFRLGEPREALPWMRKAVELAEEPDATLYDHLGDILAALGESEEARQAWQRAYELKPDEARRRKLESSAVLSP